MHNCSCRKSKNNLSKYCVNAENINEQLLHLWYQVTGSELTSCAISVFKLQQWGEVRRYGNLWPVADTQLAPRNHHVCESVLEEPWANHLFYSKTEYVCGTACGAWNLTVRVCWRTCLQTRTDAFTHKHTLKLVIGLIKPKDKNSKISPLAFV